MNTNGTIPITDRQLELLACVASGATIDEAAGQLHVAPRTAYNQLSQARDRADVKTVTHLAVTALRRGWLEMDDEGVVTPAAHLSQAA